MSGTSLGPIETSSGADTCGTPTWKNGQTAVRSLSHSHPLFEGIKESPGLGEVALAAVSEAPVNTSCVNWRRSCVNWLVFTRFWVSQLVVLARADREGRERVLGLKKTSFLQNRERRYFFDLGSVRGGLRWTVACLENRDYVLAIRRAFGSWRKALDAAGVSQAK